MSTTENTKEQTPIFAEILQRLDSSLNHYEHLSCMIHAKANKLLINNEKLDDLALKNVNQTEVVERPLNTIVEILTYYNDRFIKINNSLNITLDHLNKII